MVFVYSDHRSKLNSAVLYLRMSRVSTLETSMRQNKIEKREGMSFLIQKKSQTLKKGEPDSLKSCDYFFIFR